MPPYGKDVIVYITNGAIVRAYHKKNNQGFEEHSRNNIRCFNNEKLEVLYWMDIPEFPDVEDYGEEPTEENEEPEKEETEEIKVEPICSAESEDPKKEEKKSMTWQERLKEKFKLTE